MANYFVSRHRGAMLWFTEQGIDIKEHYQYCEDIDLFIKNDVVYGNLPINLIEILTKRGVRYFNLVLDVPLKRRGAELIRRDFEACNPRFIEYQVIAIKSKDVFI
jgi:CRISPR-associated protein Csx16